MTLSWDLGVRVGVFAAVFAIMALWEVLAERRSRRLSRRRRWTSNLGIVAIDTLAVRFLIPVSLTTVALFAADRGWGLLNQFSLAPSMAILAAVVALDLVVYIQHVVFHAVPALWRLHLVHHADVDFDLTTGIRFHPLEILISMGVKIAAVVLLGTPASAVLIFEVLLNGSAMFNHGNVSLPATLDRIVRTMLVTPDMHRVHHSVERPETHSNFGFCLPWWDRMFGTYTAQPRLGQDGMKIGLTGINESPDGENLLTLIAMPFKTSGAAYTSNRRKNP